MANRGRRIRIHDDDFNTVATFGEHAFIGNLDGFAYNMGKKDDPRCMDVGRFATNVVNMPWKSFENSADSGVSAMRHMETYMGLADRWECGLKKRNDRPLKQLRIKFCSSILQSETNLLKKEVQGKAMAFGKGAR